MSARYYQKSKERIPKFSRRRYQNVPEEEKSKRENIGRERYIDLSENEKQKLVEYRKR